MKQAEATMSEQGRITLPATVRTALRLRPGDRLIFDQDDAGHIHVRAKAGSPVDTVAKTGDLSLLPKIVQAARPHFRDRASDDPIGDYLIAEDDRTKLGR